MRFARHLIALLVELGQFARENKAWWILPVVGMLLLLGLLLHVAQSTAPLLYSGF